ncbi:MAG TPA: hypothetical protein VIK01_20640 [Polyangiaceae bacterium]
MRKALGTALGSSVAASTALCALWATGCVQSYKAPALPNNQLALVTLDSSASVLDVDGLAPPSGHNGQKLKEFFVGAGCREVTAKYEESYFIWGGKKAEKAGLGTGLAVSLANTEQHDYETMKPIRFFVPTKAGRKYWITATFTGDEFLPRVVEIEPSGDAVNKFLPDEPCKTSAQP